MANANAGTYWHNQNPYPAQSLPNPDINTLPNGQQHQQQQYYPPPAPRYAPQSFTTQQPHSQVQLEHHYDLVHYDLTRAGVSGGGAGIVNPGTINIGPTSPKYTAATATGLSAGAGGALFQSLPNAGQPPAFPFGHSPAQQQQSQLAGTVGEGIPPDAPSPPGPGPTSVQGSVLQTSPRAFGFQPGQQQEYLLPGGYTPHHHPQIPQQSQRTLAHHGKRRRSGTVTNTSQSQDGDSDYGADAYVQVQGPGQGGSPGQAQEYDYEYGYDNFGEAYEYEQGPAYDVDGANAFGPSFSMMGGAVTGSAAGLAGATIPGQNILPGQSQATGMTAGGQEIRPRPQGACVRCKNLKVRCEFNTDDPYTCRRCRNASQECSIPGRKKRRQPPKREHLLNQIREQATTIEKLMGQLEIANRRAAQKHPEPARLSLSNTPLPAPGHVRTPIVSASGTSYIPTRPGPDIQAWIAQARESMQAIGGLIDNGAFAETEEDGDIEGDGSGLEDIGEGWEGEEDEEGGSVSYFGGESGGEDEGSIGAWRSDRERDDADGNGSGIDEIGTGFEATTVRHLSPASTTGMSTVTTVPSSRETSVQPQTQTRMRNGNGRRRTTPQPSRLAPLPTTPAAPVGLIAQLAIAAEAHRDRDAEKDRGTSKSQSPRGAQSGSRAGSMEAEPSSAGTTDLSPVGSGLAGNGSAQVQSAHLAGSHSQMGEAGEANGVKREELPVVTVKIEPGISSEEDEGYGAVAPGFWEARRGSVPDPSRLAPSRHPVPHILMRGIVSPEEVEVLFNIYFDKMNLSCNILDPVLYTAQKTYWRSPFLFTVICAVASRYHPNRPGLYEELTTYAQLAAGTALISGPKTVETVSAYILLSLYPVPMRRWEEDRTWLYLGLAIRVATDLNLHHPPSVPLKDLNEVHARELLNRTRVWLNCYNLDRSTASWHGKSSTIDNNDYVATHIGEWYNSSQYNMANFDIHLAAYNAELRKLGEFKKRIYGNPNNPTGLNKDLELSKLASETDETLLELENEWSARLIKGTDISDPQARFRNSLIKLAYRYGRLTVLSFGFEHSFGKDHSDPTIFFGRCYRAATELVRVFIDELSTQSIYLRHGPDAQCVFVTFASAFLIKILHPKYAAYLSMEQRIEIQELLKGIINLLSSPEVAIDDKHAPKLWARFLDGLLATPMARIDLSPNVLKGGNALPRRHGRKGTHRSSHSDKRAGSATSSTSSQRGASPIVSSPESTTGVEAAHSSPGSLNTNNLSPPPPPPALPSVPEETRYPSNEHQQDAYAYIQNGPPIQQSQSLQNALGGSGSGADFGMQNALQMTVPEFFQPPMPFNDQDLLQSMQSMADPSIWSDMNMPCFNWIGNLQFEADTSMTDSTTQGIVGMSIPGSQIPSAQY